MWQNKSSFGRIRPAQAWLCLLDDALTRKDFLGSREGDKNRSQWCQQRFRRIAGASIHNIRERQTRRNGFFLGIGDFDIACISLIFMQNSFALYAIFVIIRNIKSSIAFIAFKYSKFGVRNRKPKKPALNINNKNLTRAESGHKCFLSSSSSSSPPVCRSKERDLEF